MGYTAESSNLLCMSILESTKKKTQIVIKTAFSFVVLELKLLLILFTTFSFTSFSYLFLSKEREEMLTRTQRKRRNTIYRYILRIIQLIQKLFNLFI